MTDAKLSKIPMDPGYIKTEGKGEAKLKKNIEYRKIIGSTKYKQSIDIAVAVSILGRKVSCPSQRDLVEAENFGLS